MKHNTDNKIAHCQLSQIIDIDHAGWGPPVISGFINHEITPINYSYIYHKATEIRQLNAILGAPSCTIFNR